MTESKSSVTPIFVKRNGVFISAPGLTEEQLEDLSMAVSKAFSHLNWEDIREAMKNYQAEARLHKEKIMLDLPYPDAHCHYWDEYVRETYGGVLE